ncbi:MAG: rod shape-determining protein MreD [Zymomonas mobilis]|uniref:Rod shape-determining protein MreD n=1 Tax=Zymomonas mobilis TaxID=542 RepID=A0A542VZU4_ZYMMB|nr:rod shape-determining protein MreD [Zymomonas mobilis]TQL16856.1 hypothetical protein FBY58_0404 [Zymomonas mobilis]
MALTPVNGHAVRPIISQDQDLGFLPIRAKITPIIMVLLASLFETGPFVSVLSLWPSLGFLTALGWRLFRPELWQAWMGLPLGMANDIINGQPPAVSMITWTFCFLMMDIVDNRLVWRNYWQDWVLATVAILFCSLLALLITYGFKGHIGIEIVADMPRILVTILLFPVIEFFCSVVDRWRLGL